MKCFYISILCIMITTLHSTIQKSLIHKALEIDYHYMIQTDGKIVTFGTIFSGIDYNFLLSRYTSTGQLDTTFGTNGTVSITSNTLSFANICALQSDGTFLIDGYKLDGIYQNFILLRYTTNGTLDTTFGTNGILTISYKTIDRVTAYKKQSDGTFFVSGYTTSGFNVYFTLLKYTATGKLDTTFGTSGKLITSIRTIKNEKEEEENNNKNKNNE